jgi:hypothetical protein
MSDPESLARESLAKHLSAADMSYLTFVHVHDNGPCFSYPNGIPVSIPSFLHNVRFVQILPLSNIWDCVSRPDLCRTCFSFSACHNGHCKNCLDVTPSIFFSFPGPANTVDCKILQNRFMSAYTYFAMVSCLVRGDIPITSDDCACLHF